MTKKQSVLIVHNDYQLSGGEGSVASADAALLKQHGHAVTEYRRDNAEIAAYGALQKLRLAFTTVFSGKTYREVRALIRANGVDVVHVHNTVPLISPSVYYAAWAEHVPVVQTVHNYRFLCPNGLFYRDGHVCEECLSSGLGRAVRYGCYRHSRAQSLVLAGAIRLHRLLGTYGRIEAYICLTAFGKGKLAQKVPESHIYIKPNAVRVEREALPYAQHGEDYVFVGRLDSEKGVWPLLHAFSGLPEHRLVVIGSGPEEDSMRAYIEENDLQNVVMIGQLPHEQVVEHVAHARALVMPTQWYEGLPLTVLEAFALGTPVIGSQIGNVGAILGEHGGGFTFDQTDSDALARCVTQCTREQLAAAAEQALQASRSAYGAEDNYQTLLSIYAAAAMRRGIGA